MNFSVGQKTDEKRIFMFRILWKIYNEFKHDPEKNSFDSN
jgi:hypothetical protein